MRIFDGASGRNHSIQSLIYRATLRSSLIPIFTIEVVLLLMYFGINAYISRQNQDTLLRGARVQVQEVASREVTTIDHQLREVTRLAQIMRADHERFFQSPQACELPHGEPQFRVHGNGAFYKFANNGGASLYYSGGTALDAQARRKARCSESLDPLLQSIVDTNPLVTQAYLNTWDDMNRLYPFMEDAPGQYGPTLNMEDYNFYHDADAAHNPGRQPVWTGVYLDPAGQGWMASVIVPIYRGDFLEGVSGLDVTVDAFVQNVLSLKMPWRSASLLVDDKGMILAMQEEVERILHLRELKTHVYDDNVRETVEKPEEFNMLTRGDEAYRGQMRTIFDSKARTASLSINGVQYIVSQESVPETGWRLVTLIDEAEVFRDIAHLKTLSDRIGYAAIVVMLLFYAVFFVYVQRKSRRLAQHLAEPVEALSAATRAFVERLQAPALVPVGIRELDELATNFSAMVAEIEKRTTAYLEAKMAAEEASRLKSIFLANMSHEIRTPLNGIMGMAQLMDDPELDTQARTEFAQLMQESAQRLHELLSDILDMSQLEAGKMTLESHPCVPAEIVQDVLARLQAQADAKAIALTAQCDLPPECATLQGDPLRLRQMLQNLVDNAVKFTAAGSVQVDCTVVESSDGLVWVEFAVSDTGIGVAADRQHLLFQPFTQVDGSATRAFGGTGLGLSLVRQFAELMGGSVGVDSAQGRGSRFWFRVPLSVASPR